MQFLKKIVLFLTLFAVYIILRELIKLYVLARSLHPWAGYATAVLIVAAIGYFIVLPVIRILRIPVYRGPATNPTDEPAIIKERLEKFTRHPSIVASGFERSDDRDIREQYKQAVKILRKEADKIRKRYVSQLFYTSAVSQNGFIDAVLILSSSIALIKEIFLLYNGRVSNRDLWVIAKKVYLSMAIGGSEGVEYATEELVSKFASDSVKSIPFIEKILGSLADGFVNAVLLNRISYITENYCTMTYIKTDRELSPSPAFVATATKNITADITDRMVVSMRRLAIEKPIDMAMMAVNPIRYFFHWTFDKMTPEGETGDSWLKSTVKDGMNIVTSPFTFIFGKLAGAVRKQ